MADQKISELTAITNADVVATDQLAIVDTSAVETKSILISEVDLRYSAKEGTPTSVTPTLSDNSNIASNILFYYYDNRFMYGDGTIKWNGAGGGGTFSVQLPDSAVADTDLISSGTDYTQTGAARIGDVTWFNSGTSNFHGPVYLLSNTTLQFYTSIVLPGTIFAASDKLTFKFKLPIVGRS